MAEKTQDIYLQQGKSKPLVLRCETTPYVSKPITAISLASGAPRLTVNGHGLVDGWDTSCNRVGGMKPINAKNNPPVKTDNPATSDVHQATVIDANTIEFNEVIPIDDNDREWPAYTSGGFIRYATPLDLTGYAARMDIRNKKNGDTVLFSMTTTNKLIVIDNALKTVTLYFDAADFSALTWKKGYYELELFKTITRDGASIVLVYSPLEGNIYLDVETTR